VSRAGLKFDFCSLGLFAITSIGGYVRVSLAYAALTSFTLTEIEQCNHDVEECVLDWCESQSSSILATGGLGVSSTAIVVRISLRYTEIWGLYRKFVWCC
jgi:hypothetical protein